MRHQQGWRQEGCSCASPVPTPAPAPCNLLLGRGAPARHPLGQGPPGGFPACAHFRRGPGALYCHRIVTVCLFPHLPPGDFIGTEFSNPPPDEFGAWHGITTWGISKQQ